MTCTHFVPVSTACAAGVVYLQLAGGGAHTMIFRLPCLPLTNRHGQEARTCAQYCAPKLEGKAA